MNYKLTTPCDACPFLKGSGFRMVQLRRFTRGEFACHKACDLVTTPDQGDVYESRGDKTPHCAGALIFLEKQGAPHQMMRICERLGIYDMRKLDMDAPVAMTERELRREA